MVTLSNSNSDSVIIFNHPLYLHPPDTPRTLLVSHQLLGVENYNVWSRSMKIALLGKNKLCLVDGTCSKESFSDKLAINGSDIMLLFYLGF